MTDAELRDFASWDKPRQRAFLAEANRQLQAMTTVERVRWTLAHLPGEYVLSSSFGAQAAVMLHLVSRERPAIPVVLLDTGYLFPETYQFIDDLTERLQLNLQVYRSPLSPAWQEARFGRLWEQGIDGIERYNRLNKVEPMERALRQLKASTWFAGLRRDQSDSRANTKFVTFQRGVFKVHPIADWTDRDIYRYLQAHDLPYHPLWDQGYVSIGDTHTTAPLGEGMLAEQTRFFGLKRECGLHEPGEQDGSGI